ncbi:MAG TPA: electron transfer flavoprotein subunit alpha/FixB family protein [Syntrophales bacterium]|nr:electron transfer flavoprotein subunit alpha/FixB family protein [Syntrophales bacterium]
MAGVWVLGENREQLFELLSIGRSLADRYGTTLVAFAFQDAQAARDCIAHGADRAVVLKYQGQEGPLDVFLPAIVEEVKGKDPDMLLIASTYKLKELAARIAERLKAGLCSDCIRLVFNEGEKSVEMERLMYGGSAIQRVICLSRPAMATIPPGTFEKAEAGSGRVKEGDVDEIVQTHESAVTILERKVRERESKDIREARTVICVGRGFEKKEDIKLAEELATVLRGEIAGTRPVTEEMHWLPESRCIGLSGIQVRPDLYIGLGVSGQIQHVTGLRDAKVICAVNRDANAPIFGVSDLGIVGDLYDVVPKLVDELKKGL